MPTATDIAYYNGSRQTIAPSARAIAIEMDSVDETSVQGARFARGIVAGLVLEAALGLCIYAMWHLYHLAR